MCVFVYLPLCIQFLTNTIAAQSGLMRAYGTVILFRKIRIYVCTYIRGRREIYRIVKHVCVFFICRANTHLLLTLGFQSRSPNFIGVFNVQFLLDLRIATTRAFSR